jgi:molybdate transport system regulatory protein
MNKLPGKISKIQQSGAILLVDIDVDGHGFSALLIESASQCSWLQPASLVEVVFKETEVSLAKNLSGLISTRNRIACTVQHIEHGETLAGV